MTIYSGDSTRFGDTPLAFGMTRFESAGMDKRFFWRFHVSRYCGRPPLIEIDADLETLREMQRFIERAISHVESDGGRKGVAA